MKPPCLIFEDEHLLVINKPAGLNTHSPGPFAGEGLYEWLCHREPRWASLAIIHRLDKETSGLILFSKTPVANRSLTEQFTERAVRKKYLLLTDRALPARKVVVKTALVRAGDRYLTRPVAAGSNVAETNFTSLEASRPGPGWLVEAEPLTGRTHQIRAQAASRGFPILGDARYGGTPYPRVCLHAAELSFRHPVSAEPFSFTAPADFSADPAMALRQALINPDSTSAFRLIHGASDGWPGWYVDLLGSHLLSQSVEPLTGAQKEKLAQLVESHAAFGAYHKQISAAVRVASPVYASPRLAQGSAAPDHFSALEQGLEFSLSFTEGYSVGLFLDQRDNRRRLLTGHIAADFTLREPGSAGVSPSGGPGSKLPTGSPDGTDSAGPGCDGLEVLNTFAYTCGFSVYAAKAGARVTSLDLSRKYLDWGKANFKLNHIEPDDHDFIFGDVFDWLRRLHKKGRAFDVIVLDPPTFSRSKVFGSFRAEKDYGKLVAAALPVLKRRGVLFASCNTASWPAEEFVTVARNSVRSSGRAVLQEHFFPQPPDFPVSRAEPGYLKTVWFRVA